MPPEFSRPLALGRVGVTGRQERLEANAGECAALARRFGVISVRRLVATIVLRPEPRGAIRVEGRLDATVEQACVVSLEPLVQAVTDAFVVRILPEGREPSDGPEDPDEIPSEGGMVDLGEVVAAQLSLALDPYPRAADAVLPAAATDPDPDAVAEVLPLRPRG